MANTFDCPNCGQKLTAKPEMAGVIIDCPACGSQIQVPAFEAPVPMVPQPPAYPSGTIPQRLQNPYGQQISPQPYGQMAPQPYPQQMQQPQQPYGYPPQQFQPPSYGQVPAQSGKSYHSLAVTAFIFSFLIAIVGLILGIVAINGMKDSGNTEGKGLATAAVWISAVWMAIVFLVIVGNS